jgi:uncharacterized protein YkwD
MGRAVRTIIIGIAVAVTVIAVPPPASAANLGDLIGIITGGESEPPQSPPPQPSPPQSPPPAPQGRPVPADSKLLAPESSCPGQSDPSLSAAARARAMACMQSYARVAKGRKALRVFKPLRTSATNKTRDIRRCHKFSHEACGRDPFYWFRSVGFCQGTWLAGEVLAFGGGESGTVRATMRAWLGSEPHRAVLLHPRFNRVGIGSVTGSLRGVRDATIWAAHLGYRNLGEAH